MKIALLCATERGLLVLEKLASIVPSHTELLVVTFREEPWEPPFLDKIRLTAQTAGADFIEIKNVASPKWQER